MAARFLRSEACHDLEIRHDRRCDHGRPQRFDSQSPTGILSANVRRVRSILDGKLGHFRQPGRNEEAGDAWFGEETSTRHEHAQDWQGVHDLECRNASHRGRSRDLRSASRRPSPDLRARNSAANGSAVLYVLR
jgi:hypothetical protein